MKKKISYLADYEKNFENDNLPTNSFTMYYTVVLRDKNLSKAGAKVLCCLKSLSKVEENGNKFNPSNQLISWRSHLSEKSVKTQLENLEKLEYIKIKHSGKDRIIKILYNAWEENKDHIKVYDRIEYYPILNFSDILVYFAYVGYSNFTYTIESGISMGTIGKRLGMDRSRIVKISAKLKELKLIKINSSQGEKACVKPLIDFSKPQPEEDLWKEKIIERKELLYS